MCGQDQLQTLLREIYEFAQAEFGEKLHSVILYGSYARGDFDEESDVDVMVLADVGLDIKRHAYRLDLLSSRLSLEYGVLVCILIKPFRQFEHYKTFIPFYTNVDREGVRFSA